MRMLAAVCGLAFAIVGMVVGIRLIALARRTRGLPELLIAVALLCGGLGVGFLRVMALHAPLSEGLVSAAALGVHVCRGLATGAIVVMVWRVFAPERAWASALAGTVLLCLALALVGEFREMRPPATTSHPLYWLWNALLTISFGWGSWASLRYYAGLRRRMRLGLADPVVANRIFLWGFASGCIAIQSPVVLASMVLSGEDRIAPWALVIFSALSCLASATVWLAFFPPRSYLKRIAARAAAREGLPCRARPLGSLSEPGLERVPDRVIF